MCVNCVYHILFYSFSYSYLLSSSSYLLFSFQFSQLCDQQFALSPRRGRRAQTPRLHHRRYLSVAIATRPDLTPWGRRWRWEGAGGRQRERQQEGFSFICSIRPPCDSARARSFLRRPSARLRRRARTRDPLGRGLRRPLRRRARAPTRFSPLPRSRQQEAQGSGRRHGMLYNNALDTDGDNSIRVINMLKCSSFGSSITAHTEY